MQYARLGPTGAFVSRLCFGSMTFGGAGHAVHSVVAGLDQAAADRLVGMALDAGINLFDSANSYSGGESEVMLGRALGARRKDVLVATKLHNRMGPGANEVGQSRVHIMRTLEDSLRRLGTDHIDLYQIHKFDPLTPFEESLRTFDDAVRQGKVRYIGCSNLAAWQVMKALGVAAAGAWEKFVSIQAYYSLAGRDIEREIVPLARDQDLALLTWSPLAGGLLSGKFGRGIEPDAAWRRKTLNYPPVDPAQVDDIVDALRGVAGRRGATVAQVALAWQLHQPAVTSVILGARTPEQLADNLKAAEVDLAPEDMTLLDGASRLKPEYPGWALNQAGGRLPGQQRQFAGLSPKP